MIQACVVFILSDLWNNVAVQLERDDPSMCCFMLYDLWNNVAVQLE